MRVRKTFSEPADYSLFRPAGRPPLTPLTQVQLDRESPSAYLFEPLAERAAS